MEKNLSSEIEKLYKLAGCAKYVCTHKVQKYCDENIGCRDPYFNPYPLCEGEKCNKEYKNIVFDEYECCFTAEKQLNLIKWFIRSRLFSSVKFSIHYIVDDIASCIVFLWDEFTETEQEEIENILKG